MDPDLPSSNPAAAGEPLSRQVLFFAPLGGGQMMGSPPLRGREGDGKGWPLGTLPETPKDDIHCIFTVDRDPYRPREGAPERRPRDNAAHTTSQNPCIFTADRLTQRYQGPIRCTGTASREKVWKWEGRAEGAYGKCTLNGRFISLHIYSIS